MKKNTFTLIELLVVIAIIAVLAGMLLPAMSKAKRAVVRVSCANNQKTVLLACQYYSQNNDEYLLPTRVYGVFWNELAAQQLYANPRFEEKNQLWKCPGENDPVNPWGYSDPKCYLYGHLSLNANLSGSNPESDNKPYRHFRKSSVSFAPSRTIQVMGNAAKQTYELMSESIGRVAFRHGNNPKVRSVGIFGFLDGHTETRKEDQCQEKTTNMHYKFYFEGWKGRDNFLNK